MQSSLHYALRGTNEKVPATLRRQELVSHCCGSNELGNAFLASDSAGYDHLFLHIDFKAVVRLNPFHIRGKFKHIKTIGQLPVVGGGFIVESVILFDDGIAVLNVLLWCLVLEHLFDIATYRLCIASQTDGRLMDETLRRRGTMPDLAGGGTKTHCLDLQQLCFWGDASATARRDA